MDTPTGQTPLSAATVDVLAAEGIRTIADLGTTRRREVQWMPGIGRKRLAEIDKLLHAKGLRLIDDPETGSRMPGERRKNLYRLKENAFRVWRVSVRTYWLIDAFKDIQNDARRGWDELDFQ